MFKVRKPVHTGLNIIIVGCGKVGATLIEQLRKEGHDITIIDQNAKKVNEIANYYDIMGLAGNGASYNVQMEAGIAEADLIIAVTNSDELNLLCCTVAKQVGRTQSRTSPQFPATTHNSITSRDWKDSCESYEEMSLLSLSGEAS